MTTATLQPTDMSGWAPVTKHYKTGDGHDLAVESSNQSVPAGAQPMIAELLSLVDDSSLLKQENLRPTVIFACTSDGFATDLTPLHEFPPGTSHEDALTQAGYEVTV